MRGIDYCVSKGHHYIFFTAKVVWYAFFFIRFQGIKVMVHSVKLCR